MIYYCTKCAKKWRWPQTVVDNHVRNCEICGSRGLVHSAPASRLPDPIGILTEEEKDRDAQTFPE